jgi:arginyl-tRNA synthetase
MNWNVFLFWLNCNIDRPSPPVFPSIFASFLTFQMQNVELSLQKQVADALQSLGLPSESVPAISLQPTRPEFEGDLTLVCFPFTKLLGKGPEQIGQLIGEFLIAHGREVIGFNVVKGFLNLSVSDRVWIAALWNFTQNKWVGGLPDKGLKVLVEFSSPNTNKPLHLGHLRNNFLGASLSELLSFAGFKVIKANLVNDRGIHICKSMVAYIETGNDETPESSGVKGDHLVGKYYVKYDQIFKEQVLELVGTGKTEDEAKVQAPIFVKAKQMLLDWEAGKPEIIELWKTMNGWVYAGFSASYQRMGVTFDKYYYESDTYILGKDIIEEGLSKGVFYRKEDGSVWIDLTKEGLDHKLVLRSDGTSVYITQDMGTADLKYENFKMDRSVYVVGNEQDYHFEVLFHILKRLGRPYAYGLFHLSYGMVDLPSGKMKSREGTVVDADELMDEMVDTAKERTQELGKTVGFDEEELIRLYNILGIGAIKYFLLKVDPKKRMQFNPSESIELNGNTATAIQYTHARISAICRKAHQLEIGLTMNHMPPELQQSERELVKHILRFVECVEEAALAYSPAIVANYMYETSRLYNSFFAHETIFQTENPQRVQFRVALSNHTGEILRSCGKILGIEMPERM